MSNVLDGLRGYIQLASGLTDVTKARAQSAAKALLAQGEAGVGSVVPPPVRAQVSALADDLVATSRANRDMLVNVVRTEVDRSVNRLGLVSARDLDAASRRARGLERRVAELEQELSRTRASSATRSSMTKKTTRNATKKGTSKSAKQATTARSPMPRKTT